MLRILLAMLAISLLTVGYAWADGEFSDYDIIDLDDVPVSDDATEYEVVPAGEPVPINPEQMGMYFGAGDEFKSGVPQGEGEYYLMHNHDRDAVYEATGAGYHDEQVYSPGYYGDEGYSVDNVYGPMWGVPEDAAGLEGYHSEYYLYNPDGEQVWTPYEGEHQHDAEDSGEEAAEYEDGLDITSSEDW